MVLRLDWQPLFCLLILTSVESPQCSYGLIGDQLPLRELLFKLGVAERDIG